MEDLDRAKALMAEAGYCDGIEVEWLTSIPNYFSLGERVISQLRRIGITAKLQTMERGTFFDRLEQGDTNQDRTSAWGDGNQILLIGTGTAGAFVARFKAYVGCEPFASRMCVPEIDEIIAQYDASVNPAEREELAAKANAAVADGYYKIPIYWFSFIDAVGPRIAVMYLVLQRQFREGCGVMPAWRRGAWHGSVGPVRYCPAYPAATAATLQVRTVPGAAFPAPPGRPAAS